jgi:hypothetical protein
MLKDFASAGLKMKTLSVLLVVFGKETPTADRLRDLDLHPNATGQALIRRGKTDLEGQGREGGVLVTRDGEMAQGLDRACADQGWSIV